MESGLRQRIVERNHRATGIAEDDFHALVFERLADDLGAGQLYGLDLIDVAIVAIGQGRQCCFYRCHCAAPSSDDSR